MDTSKTDRYGRQIGKIWVNGRDANLDQVRTGMAWHYKQYQNEQSPSDRALYADAEDRARQQRIGLWADSAPLAPWAFRHGDTDKANPVTNTDTACPCSTGVLCTGPKGGRYCLTPNGRKQYR